MPDPEAFYLFARHVYRDLAELTRTLGSLRLRRYQQDVAAAVLDSIFGHRGFSFAVMFPRQSGKNELQAQLEAYLLLMCQNFDAEMVKISPTWKPQSLNAMRRLERVLDANAATQKIWQKESGYIYRVGRARIFFLSGSPETHIVGATANLLLQVDEAQDIQIAKYDREIAPMAASANATRVFWGTAWTSRTLLARELRLARDAEQQDGQRRAFVVDADAVAREVPAYGHFVAGQVARLGRSHPTVRTQYFAEELDAEGGMFPPARLMLMQGLHPAESAPQPGVHYAVTIDLAGEDENAGEEAALLANPLRDLTALTVARLDLSTLQDELLRAPTYRAVQRYQWTGVKHSELYGRLRALLQHWRARRVVVDATGVGAGLASFLRKSLGEIVTPFLFTASSKSRLGWDFLTICDTGRWKEPALPAAAGEQALHIAFWQQCRFCEFQVLDGPGKWMRWGVPDGRRDPASGEVLHDDLLVSAALFAVLDGQEWYAPHPTTILHAPDVLDELDEGF